MIRRARLSSFLDAQFLLKLLRSIVALSSYYTNHNESKIFDYLANFPKSFSRKRKRQFRLLYHDSQKSITCLKKELGEFGSGPHMASQGGQGKRFLIGKK